MNTGSAAASIAPPSTAPDSGNLKPAIRLRTWVILSCILIVAAGLRWHRIGQDSFWLDEVYSIEIAMGRGYAHRMLPANQLIEHPVNFTDVQHPGPWRGVVDNAALPLLGDLHPPLWYFTVRAWGAAFGFSETSLRSLSSVASMLGVVLLFFLVRKTCSSDGAALWAALLMTLASGQIELAQEARNYMLAQSLCLAAALAVVNMRQAVTASRVLAVIFFVLAALLTHYSAIGAMVAIGVYALITLRGNARHAATAAFVVAGAIYGVIWLPTLIHQLHTQQQEIGFFRESGPGFLWPVVKNIAAAPFHLIARPLPNSESVTYGLSIVYVLPIVLILIQRRRDLLLWTLWLISVIAVVATADAVNHTWYLYVPRYSVLAAPGLFALMAAMTWPMRPVVRHGIPLLVAAAMLPFLSPVWAQHLQRNREFADTAVKLSHPGGVIIFSADVPIYAYAQYLMALHYEHSMPGPVVILTEPPSAALLDQLQSKGEIVYVDGRLLSVESVFPGAIPDASQFVKYTGLIQRFTLPPAGAVTPAASKPTGNARKP